MSKRPPSAEDEFVARLIRPLAGEGAFDLKDDAARLVPPRGHELVLKTDAIVMGVHAFPEDPPDLDRAQGLAHEPLRSRRERRDATRLSPVARLAAGLDQAWLERFFEGLAQGLRDASPVRLLGGDTTRTPGPFSVSITIVGAARPGRMPTRLDARPGDLIAVTGTIGDAALGLVQRLEPERAVGWGLSAGEREHLASRYLLPQPRNALAAIVAPPRARRDGHLRWSRHRPRKIVPRLRASRRGSMRSGCPCRRRRRRR